jgi:hypothetical protein
MSDLNKHNPFVHHMFFLPLEFQTWHNLGTLAVVTELCKFTKDLFETRLRPIKSIYIFLCNLNDNDISARELVSLASTCEDLADLFRFQLQYARELHEAAIINGISDDPDSEEDFFDESIMRFNFQNGFPIGPSTH